MWIAVPMIILLPCFVASYDSIKIWTLGGGHWFSYSCATTFVHYHPVQDIRLSEQLDVNCYCVIFDPGLNPDDLEEMEVVYWYHTNVWQDWFTLRYDQWRNTSYQYPQFKVQSEQTMTVPTVNGDVTRSLNTKINVQIENGYAFVLCSPDDYPDPTQLISTTTTSTTTTTLPTSPPTTSNTTDDVSAEKSKSKSNKNDDNSQYFIIVGVIAGIVVIVLIIVIVIVASRKAKTVEKQSGSGLIGHMMRQRSTIGQAHSVYAHHTWKDAPVSELGTVVYDYDGILASDNTQSDDLNKSSPNNTNVVKDSKATNNSYTYTNVSDSCYGDSVSQDTNPDDSSGRILICHM